MGFATFELLIIPINIWFFFPVVLTVLMVKSAWAPEGTVFIHDLRMGQNLSHWHENPVTIYFRVGYQGFEFMAILLSLQQHQNRCCTVGAGWSPGALSCGSQKNGHCQDAAGMDLTGKPGVKWKTMANPPVKWMNIAHLDSLSSLIYL